MWKLVVGLAVVAVPVCESAPQVSESGRTELTAEDSDDWGVVVQDDHCAGHMQMGSSQSHMFGLSLRYNPATLAANWWGTFQFGDALWDSRADVSEWKVGIEMLGGGAAFASGNVRALRSARGTPVEMSLIQRFPWDERVHGFDRVDAYFSAPVPAGGGTYKSHRVYRAPSAGAWIRRIQTCAGGLLVDRTYARYPATAFRLTLDRQAYRPRTIAVKDCETLFVMQDGRRLRYQTGGAGIRMSHDGKSLALGIDSRDMLIDGQPGGPAVGEALGALARAYGVQQSACL